MNFNKQVEAITIFVKELGFYNLFPLEDMTQIINIIENSNNIYFKSIFDTNKYNHCRLQLLEILRLSFQMIWNFNCELDNYLNSNKEFIYEELLSDRTHCVIFSKYTYNQLYNYVKYDMNNLQVLFSAAISFSNIIMDYFYNSVTQLLYKEDRYIKYSYELNPYIEENIFLIMFKINNCNIGGDYIQYNLEKNIIIPEKEFLDEFEKELDNKYKLFNHYMMWSQERVYYVDSNKIDKVSKKLINLDEVILKDIPIKIPESFLSNGLVIQLLYQICGNLKSKLLNNSEWIEEFNNNLRIISKKSGINNLDWKVEMIDSKIRYVIYKK